MPVFTCYTHTHNLFLPSCSHFLPFRLHICNPLTPILVCTYHFVYSFGCIWFQYKLFLPTPILSLSLFSAYVISLSDLSPHHTSFCFHPLSPKEFPFLPFQSYMTLFFSGQSLPSFSASRSSIPFFTLMSSPGSLPNLCSLWCQVPWELVQVLHSNPSASTSRLLRLMEATDNPPMEEFLCSRVRCLAHSQPREQPCTVATAEEIFFSPSWKTLWCRSSSWKLVIL